MTDTPDAPPIPAPAKCRTTLTESGEQLILTRRAGATGAVVFLMLWLAIWSMGCAAMLTKLVTHFEWFFLLFAIPFFTAEIVVAGIVLWSLFGRQTIVIDRTGILVESRLFGFTRRKVAALRSVRHIEEYEFGKSNDRPMYGLRIVTTDQPLKFGYDIKDDERVWLKRVIQQRLERLGVEPAAATPQKTDSIKATETTETDDLPPALPLQRIETAGERWKVEDQIRYVTLTARGKTRPMTVLGLLFVCLFWNGIVGVFVTLMVASFLGIEITNGDPPSDGMKWFLFFFLIPFEVIGVCIFLAWLSELTASWTTRTWRVDQNELTRTTWRPFWRWTKRWPTHNLARAQIGLDPKQARKTDTLADDGNRWRIRLIDHADNEVAIVTQLTEAQAVAFHDAIRRRFVKD